MVLPGQLTRSETHHSASRETHHVPDVTDPFPR